MLRPVTNTLPLLAVLLIAASLLAGCVTDADTISSTIALPAQPPAQFSWQAWTAQTNEDIRKKVAMNDQTETFLAYRTSLAAQVDAGKLSPAQFDSLSRQKMSDLGIEHHKAAREADGPKQSCQSTMEGNEAKQVCF